MLRLGGHFSPGLSGTLRQEVPDSDAVTFPGNPAGLEGVPGTSGCPSTCVIALLGPPPISSVAGELRHPGNGKSMQRLTKQRPQVDTRLCLELGGGGDSGGCQPAGCGVWAQGGTHRTGHIQSGQLSGHRLDCLNPPLGGCHILDLVPHLESGGVTTERGW